MLSTVYPEYEWLPWKFRKSPQNYWNDLKNQQKFMDWAGKQLKVNEMSDWYKISYLVPFDHNSLINDRIYVQLEGACFWESTTPPCCGY
jgi:hypothetical protein